MGVNQYSPRATVQRRVAPCSVERLADGCAIVDFGKEAFGFLELLPPTGVRGAYVARLGELLADGRVDMEPGAKE